MKKIKVVIFLLVMSMCIPTMVFASRDVAGGALKYNGGQSSSQVYSEIWDAKTSFRGTVEDGTNYGVIATVKVGSNKYTSQWRVGYAYISASRKWYTNETSHYNYEVITTNYTSRNWGQTY